MKRSRKVCGFMVGVLCAMVLLSACSTQRQGQTNNKKNMSEVSPKPTNLLKDVTKMDYRNNELEEIPSGYVQECKQQGTIQILEYTTKDYTETKPTPMENRYAQSKECKKQAQVYLPYGYDENKTYPVFYLMHGGGDNETWYFGDTGRTEDSFLGGLLDHMIAGGELEPCIVCTPTYLNDFYLDDTSCANLFYNELLNDLIPALEGKYATKYRELYTQVSENGSGSVQEIEQQTRLCRAFGGFSMGALTTWNVFQHCLKEIGFFMPVSGNLWGAGNGEEQAKTLAKAVRKQNVSPDEFLIFAGCGGKTDIAHENMMAMLNAMKKTSATFQYTDNFFNGNFYYNAWKSGGHDVNTVCQMVYNGLPQFFEKQSGYKQKWANGMLKKQIPEKMFRKDENIEYGKWVTKEYFSQTAGRKTKVNVLLPAYYDKDRTYPVLYLLHGYYDDQDWMKNNTQLKVLLGNMMEQGLTKEMIVVCPYIYCSKKSAVCTDMNLENSLAYDNFINDLETDVMPYIESVFSVVKGKEHTAIAGFSMGGRESLYIGNMHTEQFGYVGAVCPAPGLTPGVDKSQHPGQLKENELKFDRDGEKPYLLYLSGAKDDQMVGDTPSQIHDLLQQNGVEHIWQLFDGTGHDGSSVKIFLYNYLQMVFK